MTPLQVEIKKPAQMDKSRIINHETKETKKSKLIKQRKDKAKTVNDDSRETKHLKSITEEDNTFIIHDNTKETKPIKPVKTEDKAGTVNHGTDRKKGVVQGKIVNIPPIGYKAVKKDKKLKKMMESRKKSLGINKSLDMIVTSRESFKIGDTQISMKNILEKESIKKGRIFKEKIEDSGEVRPEKISNYGIYVVQPGDNIWNVHFNILKEYYQHQGIMVSSTADEPLNQGMSSGVGKILKFSETMVIIYNLIKEEIVSDIDLLQPLSKIVIYRMDEVFTLLQEINYDNIDRIQFDGKNIWIPAKK